MTLTVDVRSHDRLFLFLWDLTCLLPLFCSFKVFFSADIAIEITIYAMMQKKVQERAGKFITWSAISSAFETISCEITIVFYSKLEKSAIHTDVHTCAHANDTTALSRGTRRLECSDDNKERDHGRRKETAVNNELAVGAKQPKEFENIRR